MVSRSAPVARPETSDPEWTIRVGGSAPMLVVHGKGLLSLVARLLLDDRVEQIVVCPRLREVHARVEPIADAPPSRALPEHADRIVRNYEGER